MNARTCARIRSNPGGLSEVRMRVIIVGRTCYQRVWRH